MVVAAHVLRWGLGRVCSAENVCYRFVLAAVEVEKPFEVDRQEAALSITVVIVDSEICRFFFPLN